MLWPFTWRELQISDVSDGEPLYAVKKTEYQNNTTESMEDHDKILMPATKHIISMLNAYA
jgi:hypothetical protein